MSQQCSRYNFGHAQDASRHHICEILYHDFHSYKVQKRPGFHFRTQKVSKPNELTGLKGGNSDCDQNKRNMLYCTLIFQTKWLNIWFEFGNTYHEPEPLLSVSLQLQCKNKICQNGGMCYILGDENMSQCVCRPGWKGPTCLIGTSCFQILLPARIFKGGQVVLRPKHSFFFFLSGTTMKNCCCF